MSDLGKGFARIHWRFWMEVGPESPLTEIPQWGDALMITEVPTNATNKQVVLSVAPHIARQLGEALLAAAGHERDGAFLKDYEVVVTIKEKSPK